MRRPLGCLSGVGLIAALIALVAVGVTVAATGGVLFAPGELNAQGDGEIYGGVTSHAQTRGNCGACHTPPWSREGMADRCADCHTAMRDAGSHLAQFHTILWAEGPEQPCRACHPEHRGATANLTEVSVTDFPHERTGFSLAAHRALQEGTPFACADCHPDTLTAFLPETCDQCHAQIDAAYMAAHRADFGGQCLECHDGVDRYSAFDHSRASFELEGAHATVRCGECHVAATSEDFTQAPESCIGCHREDDAHAGGLGEDCAGCHSPDDWKRATFDHARTRFPLTGGHAGAACAACHAGGRYEGTPLECAACHQADDEHNGNLGPDCAACHTPEDWARVSFDHATTAFPLQGKHNEVACDGCHLAGRLAGTPTRCVDCHQEDDAHDGQFGSDCGGCHAPDDWKNATFDHARTAFPLTGAHQQVECAQCHAGGRFKGTPATCVSCHQDPPFHLGLFAQGCDTCHATTGWQPARFEVPHVFPTNHGANGASPCRTCHPDALDQYTCYGCHEHTPAQIQEEHAEEGVGDILDCVRCHPTGLEGEAERDDD